MHVDNPKGDCVCVLSVRWVHVLLMQKDAYFVTLLSGIRGFNLSVDMGW